MALRIANRGHSILLQAASSSVLRWMRMRSATMPAVAIRQLGWPIQPCYCFATSNRSRSKSKREKTPKKDADTSKSSLLEKLQGEKKLKKVKSPTLFDDTKDVELAPSNEVAELLRLQSMEQPASTHAEELRNMAAAIRRDRETEAWGPTGAGKLASETLQALLTGPIMQPQLIKHDVEVNQKTYTTLIKSNLTTAKQYNTLLNCCNRLGKFKEAIQHFEEMKAKGIQPNTIIYTTLITGCAKAKQPELAQKYMDQMRAEGIPQNAWVWNALVRAYTLSGQLDKAFDLVPEMKKAGIVPDQVIYATLIHGCVEHKDLDRAWRAFDYMRTYITQPDEVTYSIMIQACAREDPAEVEKALNLLDEMELRKLVPTEVTYNSLIFACARRPDYYEEAFNLFKRMKTAGYKPDRYTYAALLVACSTAGDPHGAELVFEHIKGNTKIAMTTSMWHLLMKTYANAQRLQTHIAQVAWPANKERATGLLHYMRDKKIKIDVGIACAYLAVFAYTGDVEISEKIFRAGFDELGIPRTVEGYRLLMQAYASKGMAQEAKALMMEMHDLGIQPDSYCYSAAVLACAKANHLQSGLKYLREMRQKKISPINHLIKPFKEACRDDPEMAAEVEVLCPTERVVPLFNKVGLSVSRLDKPVMRARDLNRETRKQIADQPELLYNVEKQRALEERARLWKKASK